MGSEFKSQSKTFFYLKILFSITKWCKIVINRKAWVQISAKNLFFLQKCYFQLQWSNVVIFFQFVLATQGGAVRNADFDASLFDSTQFLGEDCGVLSVVTCAANMPHDCLTAKSHQTAIRPQVSLSSTMPLNLHTVDFHFVSTDQPWLDSRFLFCYVWVAINNRYRMSDYQSPPP